MEDKKDAIDASSEQNASIQKMVYGISHDMGAPLRAVVQLSQMLKNRLGERLDEKESYWLQLIEESGTHAQDMIEALLRYSRLSTQRQPDSKFSLRQALQQAIDPLQHQIENTSAKIDIEGDWPVCVGCEQQWIMLFSYLLENSLLYQEKESEQKPHIIINCLNKSGQLEVSVQDNGIGVKPTLWPVLTTPFKRMQTATDYPGLGMGLTYCERIAELHGGKIIITGSNLGGLQVTYAGANQR